MRRVAFVIDTTPEGWDLLAGASPGLSVFFPAGVVCSEIDSGQGEGQATIAGVECGFYYLGDGRMEIVCFDVDRAGAEAIVERIREHLSRQAGVPFTWRSRPTTTALSVDED